MAITIPNLGLVVWNAPTDPYVSAQLAENWYRVDEHDHSPGRGRALTGLSFEEGGVSTAYLVDGAVTTPKLADGAVTSGKLATGSVTVNKAAAGANGLAAGCFSAYRSSSQTSLGVGGVTVAMDAEEFDVSGWYDTSLGRYLPLLAGYYRLTALISVDLANVNTRWRCGISKNGTAFRELISQYRSTGGQPMTVGGSVVVQANGATDYFTVVLYTTDSPQSITLGAQYTYLQGELIGLL